MQKPTHFTQSLLRRIIDFLERTRPEMSLGVLDTYLRELRDVEAHLVELGTRQYSLQRQHRVLTGALHRQSRRARLEHLAVISQLVKLATPAGDPLQASLHFRAGERRPIMVAALLRGYALAVAPHAALFVGAGLVPEFIDQMLALADDIENTMNERSQVKAKVQGATVGLLHASQRGRRLVRLIDGLIRGVLESNDLAAAEWRSLRRQGLYRTTHRSTEEPTEGEGTALVTALPVDAPPLTRAA